MERPILFSTPMVQAILDGRKTQTRRIVKPQPIIDNDSGYVFSGDHKHQFKNDSTHTPWEQRFIEVCPYGSVGDVLWVRETWNQDGNEFFYKADCDINVVGWKPSIHMPKKACRIFLEITKIRLERLHHIRENDSISEGVRCTGFEPTVGHGGTSLYLDYLNQKQAFWSARESFTSLWKSINGEESWESNPWVWVIEFKRIKK